MTSPLPVTATSPSTLSRVAPYFTACGPPALQARLPPTVHWSALAGSGGQNSPCGASARCRSRSEEHTSELQSLMRISYAVFCLKKKKLKHPTRKRHAHQSTHK